MQAFCVFSQLHYISLLFSNFYLTVFRKFISLTVQTMMKKSLLMFLLTTSAVITFAQSDTLFFNKVNTFLINNVESGRINYSALKFNDQGLSELVKLIGDMNLKGKSDDFKLAFYINAYNLLVIYQVLKHYPVESPMDVHGFFKLNKFLVAGEQLSLDEIEFKKIVEPYKDPRIHFGLGCAARSCPFLYDNAYTPEHVQEQLQFRAEIIIDRPNYVSIDEKNKTVTLNKIFFWYKNQFEESAGSLIAYINKYKFYKVPADYQITFSEYDWRLNKKDK